MNLCQLKILNLCAYSAQSSLCFFDPYIKFNCDIIFPSLDWNACIEQLLEWNDNIDYNIYVFFDDYIDLQISVVTVDVDVDNVDVWIWIRSKSTFFLNPRILSTSTKSHPHPHVAVIHIDEFVDVFSLYIFELLFFEKFFLRDLKILNKIYV